MAQRRMFSPDIVCSEEFLEMPLSTQALYFHLGMRSDDDGFIQPKNIMRLIGSADDDLKILVAKRFLMRFETGVVVIKHWLIHNMIRQDRYKKTRFVKEKELLTIKPNNAYTELNKADWQPNGNQMAPQVRLGEVRLGEVRLDSTGIPPTTSDGGIMPTFESVGSDYRIVFELFKDVNSVEYKTMFKRKAEHTAAKELFDTVSFEELRRGMAFWWNVARNNQFATSAIKSIKSPSTLQRAWAQLQGEYERYKNSPEMQAEKRAAEQMAVYLGTK